MKSDWRLHSYISTIKQSKSQLVKLDYSRSREDQAQHAPRLSTHRNVRRRRRRGKNLNFLRVYVQGLLTFHLSFLHFTSGACRFKHFPEIVITFFSISIPKDNILDHLSLLSYPPSLKSTVNGVGLSAKRTRKQYQNRDHLSRILGNLTAPGYCGPACLTFLLDSRLLQPPRWFQHPHWWLTQHTGLSRHGLLISKDLVLHLSLVTLMVSHFRTCYFGGITIRISIPAFDSLIFISYSPSSLPG